ncbi:hypothetical protein H0W80_01475 [Candidatus Saccharibacteria bacterium]|nr:hypothetical protein [Candidatus Saccharibacteria bacterium]
MSSLSLVFFGTGQTSLDALIALSNEFTIESVITKPDTKTSSGKVQPTLVAQWAHDNSVPYYKPKDKAELSTLVAQKKFSSPVGVVLDYGIIIPEDVIDYFEYEIINSHFSLLPQYRGADPIRAAILGGDKTTGVTIMQIVPELDAGAILSWNEYTIPPSITEPDLRVALSEINCAILPETLKLYLAQELTPIAQDVSAITHSKKVKKENGLLDPSETAVNLERQVRAYITWPKSYIVAQNTQIVITQALVSSEKMPQGKLSVSNKKLYFGCKNGSLEIFELQPASKKSMDAQGFINGYKNLL